jgi:O-antigen/teichoic acid export membrane protein
VISLSKQSHTNYLRLAKNAISLFSEGVIARICNFIFTMIVIRHLTTFDFGFYSAILSFIAISGFVVEFGISQVLVREIAQHKTRGTELFSGAIVVCLLIYVIISPCTIIAAALSGYSPSFIYLVSFAIVGIIGNTLVLLAGAVFRAHERMVSLSFINSGIIICSAIAGIVWLQYGAGIQELVILFVVTPIINALSLILYVQRHLAHFSLSQGLSSWKSLLRMALPLAILNLCYIIIMRFDILLLAKTTGMGDAGIYSAARNITDGLFLVTQSIIGAVFPLVSVQWKKSVNSAVKNYERTLRLFAIFAMAATVGVFLLSEKIIVLLYDERYLESILCLKILIWSFMIGSLAGPSGMLLIITENRLNHFIPYAIGVTCVSLFLNLWLTPKYGYYSASYIAVLSSLSAFAFRVMVVRDILTERVQWLKIIWRPVVASMIMGISLIQIDYLPLSALLALGFIVYMTALFAMGEFADEYRVLLSRLRSPDQ